MLCRTTFVDRFRTRSLGLTNRDVALRSRFDTVLIVGLATPLAKTSRYLKV